MATPAMYLNDPSAGLEIIDQRGEGIEATRYVFLAMDVLDPDRREVEHLRKGGEEVSSHCLRRSPNFVQRCTITPVEMWVEHMPLELVPDGVRSVEVKDTSLALSNDGSSRSVIQNMLRGKPLRSIRVYPGEEMNDIIGTYQKVGIVELEGLKGVEWADGIAQGLQEEFFPSNWLIPVALRAVEERITDARNAHPRVADDMLRSISQSRRWAQARLQAEHVLLDTRTRHEWTYTYSPIARNLLAQLEMTPRDQGWETMMAQSQAQMTAAIAQGMTAGNNGNIDINALAAAIATATVAAMNAHKTVEQVQDEAPRMYTCEHCGDEVKLSGKGIHTGIHCRVLHPKVEGETETE